MENPKEIRWKQRFENFEKAFIQLEKGVRAFDKLDDIGKEGLIQRFEYSLELAWKTLKDYLESKGTIAKFPRDVIKIAFQNDLINDGEIWMKMLKDRILMAHTYDENNFNTALVNIITLYFGEIKNAYNFLKSEQ